MIRNPTIHKLKESFDNTYPIMEAYLIDHCQNELKDRLEYVEVDETDMKNFMFDAILCKLGLQKYTLRLTNSFVSRGFLDEDATALNKKTIKDIWDSVMVYQGPCSSDVYSQFVDGFLDDLHSKLDENVYSAIEYNLTE